MALTVVLKRRISLAATRSAGVDFTDDLDENETLTGTPAITEVGTTHLTLTSKEVNSAVKLISGREVQIGKAVLFKVTGQHINTTYTIHIVITTSTGDVLVWDVVLRCI